MKELAASCLLLALLVGCATGKPKPVHPLHIEAPDFPLPARTAHVTGTVSLTLTIDADGRVTVVDAKASNPVEEQHPLLRKSATDNIERWTFEKPPFAPFRQTIVYDYEFDDALPAEGGPSALPRITQVEFDLPSHVSISANAAIIETNASK
jgi:TonB family protein